jgi:hypothetical protein
MKKFFNALLLLIFFSLISIITILSTIGVETNKFNNLIIKKINQSNNNINLELTTIKFRLDLKNVSLFLNSTKPMLYYYDTAVPAKNIRVYVDFLSILKKKIEIKKITLSLDVIDINQLKKLSIFLKPSNFKSFVNNKIMEGKVSADFEIYLDKKNILNNFIAKGSVSNFKANIIKDINLTKTSFSFFADKTDILVKNIFGETGPVKISDGDIKFKYDKKISLETNFNSNINYNNNSVNYLKYFEKFKFSKQLVNFKANLTNRFFINFDETYKVKKYDFQSSGKIKKVTLNLKDHVERHLFGEKISNLSFYDSDVKTNLSSIQNKTIIKGNYSINADKPLPFNLENTTDSELAKLKLNIEYDNLVDLKYINYKKPKGFIAKFSINLNKDKDYINIDNFNYTEGKNSIYAEDLKLNKNKILSFKKISINTSQNGKVNNDLSVSFGKKILIKGNKFDASNLPKIFSKKSNKNFYSYITKDIEVDFESIIAPLSENLLNFKLIGKIEKGKFTKISSKGDFGGGNYLDISMKKDPNNQKKYLEVYSDLTRPLLTEYKFFKGLTGGKLLYSSIIDDDNSTSKLKIEKFNVVNAPGMVKLLSLADLGGLADLAEGEGLSFDILEIKMDKNKDNLILNEILALGPSVSVLMEGYQNPKMTSIRGTLVPAKMFNKMISKIPVLGDIIIPKEAGEGLFGISFKMKGPPGKIKTTINPIRTVTPRFIQKIIDRNKVK